MKQLRTAATALAILAAPLYSLHADFVVGEFASLTGGNASFGQSSHKGTQLAIDEINTAGGVLGQKIKLVTEDDQSLAGQPAVIVRKLISSDKAIAILGEVASSKSLEAAPICQQAKIPMISPASTNPKVTEVGDYIFRVCFIDPFQGTVGAKFALNKGWKKVAVLTDVKQDYSKGLAEFFKQAFVANGGSITKEQSYSSGDKDFKAQLTSIKTGKPDAIYLPGYYGEVALIARQAKQLGLKVPLIGGDGWDGDSLIPVAGKAIEGSFFSNHYSDEDQSPVIQNFVKKYKEATGTVPDAMAALGYDSARILANAITKAGKTDGSAVRDELAKVKDYQAVTGVITIDKDRNATKPAVMMTVKDGKFAYVETVKP